MSDAIKKLDEAVSIIQQNVRPYVNKAYQIQLKQVLNILAQVKAVLVCPQCKGEMKIPDPVKEKASFKMRKRENL